MIVIAAVVGLLLVCGLFLVAFVRGPTAYDRLLMAHAMLLTLTLTVAGLGVVQRAPFVLEGALALALLDVLLLLACVKALRRNAFQPALTPRDEGAA